MPDYIPCVWYMMFGVKAGSYTASVVAVVAENARFGLGAPCNEEGGLLYHLLVPHWPPGTAQPAARQHSTAGGPRDDTGSTPRQDNCRVWRREEGRPTNVSQKAAGAVQRGVGRQALAVA